MTAPLVTIARGTSVAELVPQRRLLVCEGVAHGVTFTHPERLTADIQRAEA